MGLYSTRSSEIVCKTATMNNLIRCIVVFDNYEILKHILGSTPIYWETLSTHIYGDHSHDICCNILAVGYRKRSVLCIHKPLAVSARMPCCISSLIVTFGAPLLDCNFSKNDYFPYGLGLWPDNIHFFLPISTYFSNKSLLPIKASFFPVHSFSFRHGVIYVCVENFVRPTLFLIHVFW